MMKLKVSMMGFSEEVLNQVLSILGGFYDVEYGVSSEFADVDFSKYDAVLVMTDERGHPATYIAETLTKDQRCIPVIVISKSKSADVFFEAVSFGVRDWLTKDELYRLPGLIRRELAWAKEKKIYKWNIKYSREYDQITGLPNLAKFVDRLEKLVSESGDVPFALISIEVKLEEYNIKDPWRFQTLLKISDLILENLKPGDLLAHLGETKFLIATRNSTQINQIVDGIYTSLSSSLETEVKVLAGVSVFPTDASEVRELIENSEKALRKSAERQGKGKTMVTFYTQGISEDLAKVDRILNKLKKIKFENIGEIFTLHYQPIFRISGGRNKLRTDVFGYEALLRPKDEELKYLSVERIIEDADRVNTLIYLEEWVIYNACEQLRRWKDENKNLHVAINISPKFLSVRDIYKTMSDAILHAKVNPCSIMIEITESYIIDSLDEKKAELEKLREIGVHITIDDFGVKYNCFRYIKDLPADFIKISYDLVKGIPYHRESKALVVSLTKLSHELEKMVIAEGVEREEQLMYLGKIGCDFVQGFLLGVPLSPEKIVVSSKRK